MATAKQKRLARAALAAGKAWLKAQEGVRKYQKDWYAATKAAAAVGVEMQHVYGRSDRHGHSPLVGFKAIVKETIK